MFLVLRVFCWAYSELRTQDLVPATQDPGPGTQDLGHKTRFSGPGTQDSKIWDPGTLDLFIELQNKTLKSKKSLTSKRDNAKYPFTYFYLIKIVGFFFSS